MASWTTSIWGQKGQLEPPLLTMPIQGWEPNQGTNSQGSMSSTTPRPGAHCSALVPSLVPALGSSDTALRTSRGTARVTPRGKDALCPNPHVASVMPAHPRGQCVPKEHMLSWTRNRLPGKLRCFSLPQV